MDELLTEVQRTRRALERAEDAAKARRVEYEAAVIHAFSEHGYRKLAETAGVEVGAIQKITRKHDAQSTRS